MGKIALMGEDSIYVSLLSVFQALRVAKGTSDKEAPEGSRIIRAK
jgi:hypothetical protein